MQDFQIKIKISEYVEANIYFEQQKQKKLIKQMYKYKVIVRLFH